MDTACNSISIKNPVGDKVFVFEGGKWVLSWQVQSCYLFHYLPKLSGAGTQKPKFDFQPF